jgi:N,N'-diacetyllegionaminate synthase
MSRTFIIAEAGSCHDGSLEKALRLVDVANACFADAVKFQFWSDPDKLTRRRHAPSYLGIYRRYQLPAAWLPELAHRATQIGIEFMCTTYLPEDVAIVAPFVRRFKVASFEALDADFIRAHERFQKPLLVSTGMLDEREELNLYRPAVARMELLHCVSAYPAPIEELNLSLLRCPWYAGLSDHSRHLVTGAVAVACGARILETHVRLSDTDPENPDYLTAFSPYELTEYIQNVRDAEQMFGDLNKRAMPSEAAMAKYRVNA